MDEDEIMKESCNKFSRVGDGRNESMKMVQKGSDDEVDRDQLTKRVAANGGGGGGVGAGGGANPLRVWHQSSRIIRVSRATGGKDRHSKVWTSKGSRDRRVRLSVGTAIQFYDLQDRLGYDQPSKAVEWLIKAAADSIAELPELSNSFPDTPKQLSDEKRASEGTVQQDSAEIESETSKNSSLSLSRSEKKKKKKKEHESSIENHQNVNPISQNSSFTELLTGGIGNNNTSTPTASGSAHQNNPNADHGFFHKANTVSRQWPVSPQMDYFTSGLLEPPSSRSTTTHHHHQSSGFPGQIQLGNSLPQPFTVSGDQSHHHQQQQQHQDLQHFSFVPNPDQHLTTQQGQGQGGHDYNLNFTISSSLAGFNRGTLQSNISPSFLPHHHQLHRFSSIEGSTTPFYIGPPQPLENHHIFYGGDGTCRSSDHKGKGKN